MPWPEPRALDTGWTLSGPGVEGLACAVPGTVAGALRDAGLPLPADLDEGAWSCSCAFAWGGGASAVLGLDGLATICSVWLNGERVLESGSMWARHAVPVALRAENVLELRFAPLGPEVRRPRKPRARWRTRLVAGGLRWHRTMLLGRAPGFAPSPPCVGPWRPVWVADRFPLSVELRTRLDGRDGVLDVTVEGATSEVAVSDLGGRTSGVEVAVGGARVALDEAGRATVRVPDVARWWPHTHGEPVLHEVRLEAGGEVLATRRVGFRTLSAGVVDVEVDGLDLHVNGVRVFARGAVWGPVDLVGMAPPVAELRASLEALRDAGLNLVRVVGTGSYEASAFHDLCDELGLLVWQDAMCANLDYPLADPAFAATMRVELAQVVGDLAGRPSTAVLCGGSEVGQQVAMLGLDPALARDGVGYGLLGEVVAAARCDAVVVPDAPSGGARPFRTDAGVANYFGVGGYRRGFGDVRRAGVRFASECLALANVGDDDALAFRGVPRDAGSPWDFADVRDHYLGVLFRADPEVLRAQDPARYLALSREVSGRVMSEVFGEWRRAASGCGGGLILWARDLEPGSGWGLLDAAGRPKVALHHLRRALAPLAVWTTDEGLNGIGVHAANDGPAAWTGTLRVALLAADGAVVAEHDVPLELPAHATVEHDLEGLLGRFLDASGAYRFGPLAHAAAVATLHDPPAGGGAAGGGAAGGGAGATGGGVGATVGGVGATGGGVDRGRGAMRAQAVRYPDGPPLEPRSADALGLRVFVEPEPWRVVVAARALVVGVRVAVPGWAPDDDAFDLPGGERVIALRPLSIASPVPRAHVTALNLDGAATSP